MSSPLTALILMNGKFLILQRLAQILVLFEILNVLSALQFSSSREIGRAHV